LLVCGLFSFDAFLRQEVQFIISLLGFLSWMAARMQRNSKQIEFA